MPLGLVFPQLRHMSCCDRTMLCSPATPTTASMHFYACQALTDVVAHRPEEFEGKTFLLKSIAYNATARADMFTLPCSNKVRLLNSILLILHQDFIGNLAL